MKKINLLTGAVAAAIGVGFAVTEKSEASETKRIEWCQWFDDPSRPDIDGCKILVFNTPCVCEWC